MAQGNLSTGDPPLHRHIPDFGLRDFENDCGPPHWPANNKQCHSEVLAQWFLALQKSSPWKRDLLIFSIMKWTKLRATRRKNSRLPHWTKFPQKLRSQVTLERYIQNNPQFDRPSDHFTFSMLPLLIIFKWKHLWYYSPSHAKNAQEITISWKGFAKKCNKTPPFSITCLTLYIIGCHHTAPSKIHCGHLYFWHDCNFVSFLYIVNMTSSCFSFRQKHIAELILKE